MHILNNSLLNILIPKDNKALTEVLKQADTKTIEQMINNKSANVNDVLKNLFDELKNGTKSNSNIKNILKNTNIFKDLGSFSKNLSTLLKDLEQNPNLEKFKPLIENLFKNIKDLDATNLKEQISKSGVFLESKLANNSSPINSSIQKILTQIQDIIKNIDSPLKKEISENIAKILTNQNSSEQTKELKSLLTNLQNLSNSLSSKELNSLSNLTNQLQNMISKGSLVESKIQNSSLETISKEQITTQTKELVSQIKNILVQNPNLNSKNLLNEIDNILNNKDLFAKNQNFIEPKNLLSNLVNSPELKNISKTNSNISNIVLNLQNIVQDIENIETKTLTLQNVASEKNNILAVLKENLNNLKTQLSNIPNVDLSNINQLISKLENTQNLFSKLDITNLNLQLSNPNSNSFVNNFTTNLNSLVLSLKESISSLEPNKESLNFQNNVLKTVDKLETILKEIIQNPEILKNNKATDLDIKSILLQLSDELNSKNDVKSQDLLKNVDKLLTSIDYHQLNSLTSNSNYVYVPFFWEMLDEGTIKLKSTNEDKFYCQINLSLKDFGKVDLMLALYDKNRLDLTIQAQREHFKTKIQENLQKLKQALNSVDLIPVNIRIMDLKEEIETKNIKENIYIQNSDNFDLGINIKA